MTTNQPSNEPTIEARLSRLENLMVTAGDMMLQASELSRRNAEQIATLTAQAANDRTEFQEWRRTTQAALDKIDRVLDYLMQRDGNE